jgi:hypothetical protein
MAIDRGHLELGHARSRYRLRSRPGPGPAPTIPHPGRGSRDSFSICNPLAAASLISGSDGSTASIAGRGGQIREPELAQAHEDPPASARGRARATFRTTVPVYFHVITDGATGSLTSRQIDDQMRVLNQTFAGSEGGASTGFAFPLAGITRTDNPAWFHAGPGGDEHSMKQALRQGGAEALTLYSTTAGPYLGWAYLPTIVTKPGQAYLDGIVVDWELHGLLVRHLLHRVHGGADSAHARRVAVLPRGWVARHGVPAQSRCA